MNDAIALPEADAAEGAPHPRHTRQLFGQKSAEAAFLSAVNSGRLHHAWLLTGPQGVGKATLAWRLARFLLTQDQPGPLATLDPMPDHPALPRIARLSEPRLCLIRRGWDDKVRPPRLRSQITVDEVRGLGRFFGLSAADGGRRVVIVDAADEMNRNAANALLKLLEEPPDRAVLLLVAHQPARLLPTIRSRCRNLVCASLDPAALTQALTQAGLDPGPDSAALAVLANGAPGRAVGLLSGGGLALYADIAALFGNAPGIDRVALMRFAESCAGRNAGRRFDLALDLLFTFLCRLARTGATGQPGSEAVPGEAATLARLAPNPGAARVWAEAGTAIDRARRGAAVNLDPAGLILDTALELDRAARVAVS